MRDLWILLHLAGVIVWIGGMWFALLCMRPAAASLAPPQRVALMTDALGRFFGHVAWAIVAIWASGLALIMRMPALDASGARVPAMAAIALVMTAAFGVIRLRHYPALRAALAAQSWPVAASSIDAIRRLVVLNLALGAATVAVATLGRVLG